jgi:hypothetical protein
MSLDQQMESKRRCSATTAKLLIVIGSGIFFTACSSPQSISPTHQPTLTVTYIFTTEATFTGIEVSQDTLSYTFFDDEPNKCVQWVRQEPCWTQQDLKTENAALSPGDIQTLLALIQQVGFMELSDTYGNAPPGQRYYPYTLEVTLGEAKKEVIYQSFPEAPPMPEAMAKIIDRLERLVKEKIR